MSRKSERLVNLTIALLATKRFLTKAEIFRNIEGYEGSDESMERMFERDKDELRKLGVVIEVGGIDPLFDDEAGYKIRPESYALDLGALSSSDIGLLSLATQAWRGAALADTAQSALRKFQSLGLDSDLSSIPSLAPHLISDSNLIDDIAQAILSRSSILFGYFNAQLVSERREVNPYAMAARSGYWYLIGFDLTKKAMRVFRCDRIEESIQVSPIKNSFEIPTDFDLAPFLSSSENLLVAMVKIRIGKGQALRSTAKIISSDDEWDTVELNYIDEKNLIERILWHLDDAVLLEPESMRHTISQSLQAIVHAHG
ncbi:unannotated protein [freshwater metagenome]|uniref:Unannotated protein n=1 Tax=freshwater metagenome TaxID=449393 RepID=A0A6J7XRN4_9ZZZZ|nr:WYL domain-containing protein [Actinomycetota bacterium]